MTKRDLVVRITEDLSQTKDKDVKVTQEVVHEIVQKTLDYIAEAVCHGTKVELRNFGVFEVKIRKARIGRNPNAPNTNVPIPARAVVKFKPGKEMREAVMKTTPSPVAEQPAQPPASP